MFWASKTRQGKCKLWRENIENNVENKTIYKNYDLSSPDLFIKTLQMIGPSQQTCAQLPFNSVEANGGNDSHSHWGFYTEFWGNGRLQNIYITITTYYTSKEQMKSPQFRGSKYTRAIFWLHHDTAEKPRIFVCPTLQLHPFFTFTAEKLCAKAAQGFFSSWCFRMSLTPNFCENRGVYTWLYRSMCLDHTWYIISCLCSMYSTSMCALQTLLQQLPKDGALWELPQSQSCRIAKMSTQLSVS